MIAPLSVVSFLAVGCALVAVLALVSRHRALRELDRVRSSAARMALHDEATGLLNRRGADLVAAGVVTIARRDGDAACACLVDITAADGCLADEDEVLTIADAARRVFRAGDAVCRVGAARLLIVGKGAGMPVATVTRRLVDEAARVGLPGAPPPRIMVGAAVLPPWEEGQLVELEASALHDLELRRFVRNSERRDS